MSKRVWSEILARAKADGATVSQVARRERVNKKTVRMAELRCGIMLPSGKEKSQCGSYLNVDAEFDDRPPEENGSP